MILYCLMIFIIIAAFIAVETSHLLSSVICIGAAGFGSALIFIFLRAPDIAITQIVVEVLALVILIRVTLSRDKTFTHDNRDLFGFLVSVVLVLLIALAGIKVFDAFPEFGEPIFATAPAEDGNASQHYRQHALAETGAANIVTSVILDYRAYDTLGETAVLFTSIVGATVLLRSKCRNKPKPKQ